MAVDKIVSATRWKRRFIGGWRPVTQTRTRQGVDNVRSQVSEDRTASWPPSHLKSMDYDHDTRRVTPHLDIDAGPIVDIKAIGAKVSTKKLQQNVPVYEEHTVDRDLLVEGQRNLRDEFQAAGYFEAEVEFKEQKLQNDKQEIDYLINLGKRHQLVHVEIQGNRYFTTECHPRAHVHDAEILSVPARPLQRGAARAGTRNPSPICTKRTDSAMSR